MAQANIIGAFCLLAVFSSVHGQRGNSMNWMSMMNSFMNPNSGAAGARTGGTQAGSNMATMFGDWSKMWGGNGDGAASGGMGGMGGNSGSNMWQTMGGMGGGGDAGGMAGMGGMGGMMGGGEGMGGMGGLSAMMGGGAMGGAEGMGGGW